MGTAVKRQLNRKSRTRLPSLRHIGQNIKAKTKKRGAITTRKNVYFGFLYSKTGQICPTLDLEKPKS